MTFIGTVDALRVAFPRWPMVGGSIARGATGEVMVAKKFPIFHLRGLEATSGRRSARRMQ